MSSVISTSELRSVNTGSSQTELVDGAGGVDVRSTVISLTAIVLLAIGLRIVWFLIGPNVIENEGALYARVAENLLSGEGFKTIYGLPETMYTLAYSVMIAGLTWITGSSEFSARFVAMLAGAATVIPVYLIALRMYGPTVARFAGLLMAVSPLFIGFSVAAYTENPYMLFVMCGAYFLLRATDFKGGLDSLYAGIFWGLAYLTRPEGLAYLAISIGVLLAVAVLRRHGILPAIKASAVMTVAVVVLALPYVVYLNHTTGAYRLEGKNLINHTIIKRMEQGMGYHEASWGIDENLNDVGPLLVPNHYANFSPYPTSLGELLGHLPARVARNGAKYFQHFMPSFADGGIVLLLCVVLGFFRTAWTPERFQIEMIYAAIASFAVVIIFFAHAVLFRYTMPLFVFMTVWCAHGMKELCDWTRSTANNALRGSARSHQAGRIMWGATAVFVIAALFVVERTGIYYVEEITQGWGASHVMKDAGQWLKDNKETPRPVIMEVTSTVPFYSGGVFSGLPYASSDLALRYIDKIKPDYIAIWSGSAYTRPYLEDWLKSGVPSTRATLVHRVEDKDHNVAVIYRWQK